MGDPVPVLDMLTAAAWLALALVGIALRLRRLWRLRAVVVDDETDRAYLALVKRSTYLRLWVKVVFALGALTALSHLGTSVAMHESPWMFWSWRAGILTALGCMIAETISVDRTRSRLGRGWERPS